MLKDNTATQFPMFCGKIPAPWPAEEDSRHVVSLVDRLAQMLYTAHEGDAVTNNFLIAALYTPKNRDIYWASVPKGNYQTSGRADLDIADQKLSQGEFHAEHNAYLIAAQPPNNAEPGRGSYVGVYGRFNGGFVAHPCFTMRTNTCKAFLQGKHISSTGDIADFVEANRGRAASPSRTARPSDRSRSPGRKDRPDNYRERSPDRRRQRKRDLMMGALMVESAMERAILGRAIVRFNAEQQRYLDTTWAPPLYV